MKPSLFIPVIDNGMGLSRSGWAVSMFALFLSDVLKDRELSLLSISYPYPDGAMNIASSEFLRGKCEEMLVIDTDVKFKPDHVRMLLSHDVPLVAGLYPKKQLGLTWPVVVLPDNPRPFDKKDQVLCEVECVARGFMRIQRSVFEAIKPMVGTYKDSQTQQEEYEYWKPQPGGNSEDFSFCRLYRGAGGKVLVDQRILTEHIGSVDYPIKGTF